MLQILHHRCNCIPRNRLLEILFWEIPYVVSYNHGIFIKRLEGAFGVLLQIFFLSYHLFSQVHFYLYFFFIFLFWFCLVNTLTVNVQNAQRTWFLQLSILNLLIIRSHKNHGNVYIIVTNVLSNPNGPPYPSNMQ